jgi:hypothetical protein
MWTSFQQCLFNKKIVGMYRGTEFSSGFIPLIQSISCHTQNPIAIVRVVGVDVIFSS